MEQDILKNQDIKEEHLKDLFKELNLLTEENSNLIIKLSELQEENEKLKEVLSHFDKGRVLKEKRKAGFGTYERKDITLEKVLKLYRLGFTSYKIGQRLNARSVCIINNRLKDLERYGLIERRDKETIKLLKSEN